MLPYIDLSLALLDIGLSPVVLRWPSLASPCIGLPPTYPCIDLSPEIVCIDLSMALLKGFGAAETF